MKLERIESVFNMGDTSMRVKQIVDVYYVILQHIDTFMENKVWERNSFVQEEFYSTLLTKINSIEQQEGIELFNDFKRLKNYSEPSKSKIGMRGRTATNGLVKTGLINHSRKLSEVGNNYLENTLKQADSLENILNLSVDNLLYLRQFLKLRIYSHNTNKFFYNFRFALKFLSKHKNVPQNDFLRLLLSIKPDQTEEQLIQIITNYEEVSVGNEIFDTFYKEHFSFFMRPEEELLAAKEMFLNKDFSDENFIRFFSNRDSKETSLLYKDFVLNLIELIENKDSISFQKVNQLSRMDKIKKGFGQNKIPFIFNRNESIHNFFENNSENPLLSDDYYQIYLVFIFSKHDDLIKEYSDMCKRTFQITGLINFENGLANLNNDWIIKPLIDLLGDDFKMTGEEDYEDYELSSDSIWYKDISTMDILNISEINFNELLNRIGEELDISDMSSISNEIQNRQEREYRNFINTHFPSQKIAEILEYISVRNDEKVFELVTDNATIPTIYEYILTIAWYHISENKNFEIHKTFQVTLDGNKLPLSHRGGGAGDIEIISDEYSLLIEATLMDRNTQRRGELEPVIRHSINFNLQNKESNPQTIFIANELDMNVLNIFRATQFIELTGTLQVGEVNGLNIFALTTTELVQLLNLQITDLDIICKINENLNTTPIQIPINWRDSIIDSILMN